MYTVNATQLKNRLGPVLARAEFEPVAVVRHGRVVAYLTPARDAAAKAPRRSASKSGLDRNGEERLVQLCASGDLRPSRWLRAGDRRLLAGVATVLASQPGEDRVRLLALAERLYPGMSTPEEFARWLAETRVRASRLLPLVRAERLRLGR